MSKLKEACDDIAEKGEEQTKIADICNKPGFATLKPFFNKEFGGKLNAWHNTQDLLRVMDEEMLLLQDILHVPSTPSSEAEVSEYGRKATDGQDGEETYEEVMAKFADEHERKSQHNRSSASSSTAGNFKRKATEPPPSMDVDADAAKGSVEDPIGEVDWDELHEV